jgi:DNA polymerase III epsilon subunit-like protein
MPSGDRPFSRSVQYELDNLKEEYKGYQGNLRPLSQIPKGVWIMFDIETSGFKGNQDDQVTQLSAIPVVLPELRLGNEFDYTARLTGINLGKLHAETKKSPGRITQPDGSQVETSGVGSFDVHMPLAINGYHPHFGFEVDEEGNEKTYQVAGTGRHEGRIFTNKHLKKLSAEQLNDVIRHSHGNLSDEQIQELLENPAASSIEGVDALKKEYEVLQRFVNFVKKAGAEGVMGHNIRDFDIPFLRHRLQRYGIEDPFKTLKIYDTLIFARTAFVPVLKSLAAALQIVGESEESNEVLRVAKFLQEGGGGKVSSKLQDLVEALQVHDDSNIAHNSLGDVRANIKVLEALEKFIEKYSGILNDSASQPSYDVEKQKALQSQLKYDAGRLEREKAKVRETLA